MIAHSPQPDQNPLYALSSFSGPQRVQLVWFQLGETDRQPEQFWKTFTDALAGWSPDFSLRESKLGFPTASNDTSLFLGNFTAETQKRPILLIASNFQVLEENEVSDFLTELMAAGAPNAHILLLYDEARIGPESSRAAESFCFLTAEEEHAFYMGNDLSLYEQEFEMIRGFTEGWKPAAALFARHLKGKDARDILENPPPYIRRWINAICFSGHSESLPRQLVCLSHLPDFSPEMVEGLTDLSLSEAMDLIRDNPFIVYRRESGRFRYSACCQRYMEEQQSLLGSQERQDFYLRAGDWYREQNDLLEAITCYRKVDAYSKIYETLGQWAPPSKRELALCCIDAINDMPQAFVEAHPDLHVMRCHMLGSLYRYREIDSLLREFCATYDQGDQTPPGLRQTLGDAYLAWANARTALLDDPFAVCELYRRASELMPGGSKTIGTSLQKYADMPVLALPSPEAGTLQRYLEAIQKTEYYYSKATGGGHAGAGYLAAAEYGFYTRDFTKVEAPARKAIARALTSGQYDIACSACFLLMRFYFSRGSYEETMESYRELTRYAQEASYNTFFTMPGLAESWLNLKLGKIHDVADWIRDESLNQAKLVPWQYGRDRVIRAYFLLENHNFQQLLAYAETNISLFRQRGHHLMIIELMMMRAVAYHALGEGEQAAAAFEEVYRWTHQNNIIMPIVEYGSYIRQLVKNCLQNEACPIPREWLEEIGRKSNSYYRYQQGIRKQHEQDTRGPMTLLDHLTVPERKFLLLLSQGMTHREIADLQGRSVSAVKQMARRVYAKIGASNMAEAVRIAVNHHIEDVVSL